MCITKDRLLRYGEEGGKTLAAADSGDALIRAVMAGERTVDDYVARRRALLAGVPEERLAAALPEGETLESGFRRQFEARRRLIEAADRATARDVLDIVSELVPLLERLEKSPSERRTACVLRARLRRIGALEDAA